MESLRLASNGLGFHALAEGPRDGPLVLLLHGFPELARSWRHQLPALASAGFRAVAPDQRGYGESDRRGPYDLRTLARDTAGMVRALGRGRAAIVGHDWGAGVAWATAVYEPGVVERLATLNGPHPAAFADELRRNPRQLLRSAYILGFQVPFVPERLLAANRAAAIDRMLARGTRRRDAFPPEERAHYRAAFSDPRAVAAALGWYRAAFRHGAAFRRDARRAPVRAPVLVIWGVRDPALELGNVAPERLRPYVAAGNVPEVVRVEDAGHFVQNDRPERVNAELLRWLAAG